MRKTENNYAFIDSQNLNRLQEAGFVLVFKPTIPDAEGKIKGNVDADLVLRAAIEISEYDSAIIISSDGDFYSLVQFLYEKGKLEAVLSPDRKNCSILLRKAAKDRIRFMDNLRGMLEYVRKAPPGDGTRGGALQ